MIVSLLALSPVVFMGDSYASGHGEDGSSDTACMRSVVAPAGEAGNVACSAAFINHLLHPREVLTYAERFDSHRDQLAAMAHNIVDCRWPLVDTTVQVRMIDTVTSCSVTIDPQEHAIGEDTTDVVITIGGNDLGFSTIAAHCFVLDGQCDAELAKAARRIDPTLEKLRQSVEIMANQHPDVHFHLTGYPIVSDHEGVTALQESWNEAVASLAGENISYIDYPDLSEPGLIHGELSMKVFHPTAAGWKKMSEVVWESLGR